MKEAQRRYYDEAYEQVNGTGVGGFASRMYHKELEKPFGTNIFFSKILEVGSGHGEHAQFVDHLYDEYFVTDLEVDQVDLAKMKKLEEGLKNGGKITVQEVDVQAIPFENDFFDI
jgi:SAM-dependent methyltransferase